MSICHTVILVKTAAPSSTFLRHIVGPLLRFSAKQAVRVATQYAPTSPVIRRMHAAAHLQSIAYTPYACGAQRALLPKAMGAVNVNELMNINDVRESATIFPRPCKLTFDLLTSKVVPESLVMWATCTPILVFLGLSVLELFQMYATDRQSVGQTSDKSIA